MTRRTLARVFWIGAAAILVAGALVSLVAVVRGDFSDTDGRILGSLAALLYSGGTALAGFALAGRGPARTLGWIVAAVAAVALALVLWEIWSYALDADGETSSRLAVTGLIATAGGLLATTSLLLARRHAIVRLAAAAGGLAGLAAGLAAAAVWIEPEGDGYVKVLAAVCILAALAYFLVPVLQRFTQASVEQAQVRVLASLDDVELVASRTSIEGVSVPEPRPGELLVLRRRVTEP